MHYQFDFHVIFRYAPYLLAGVKVTFEVTLIAVSLGMVIGLLIAVLRLSRLRVLRIPAIVYLEVFRNTPALVLLIWLYYAIPIMTGLRLSALESVSFALAASAGANMAEIYRAGILSVNRGEVEAAKSLGLTGSQILRRIVLPQALRRMIPPFTNAFIAVVLLSSLVSVLGVPDLTYQAQNIAQLTFRPIEIFTAVAVVYMAISYALSFVAHRIEAWVSERT